MTYMQNKVALPKDLKRKNRKEILKVLQHSEKEQWSLAELSDATGISRATVAKAVTSFVEKNIFIYVGKGNSTEIGGKKPDVYAFNREYQFLTYLNIGIGWLTMAILDLKLKEKGSIKLEIPVSSSIDELMHISKICYHQLIEKNGIEEDKIYGICISTSGMINQETGVLQCTLSYPYWGKEVPLKDIFEKEFPGMMITIENVGRAAGRAELYYNKQFEDKKVFTLFTFRGISGCLIDQGKVQNSRKSLIGEIGHMIICPEDEEICRCGSRGCFENMVSEERMLKRLAGSPVKLEQSVLGKIEKIRLRDILNAANEGDFYACELIEKAAWYFSLAFRNIILTVDPEVIVIQGIYSDGGDFFLKKLTKNLYNTAYFPDTTDWTFVYDKKDIWKLAEIGLSAAMADDLFQNRELYKD